MCFTKRSLSYSIFHKCPSVFPYYVRHHALSCSGSTTSLNLEHHNTSAYPIHSGKILPHLEGSSDDFGTYRQYPMDEGFYPGFPNTKQTYVCMRGTHQVCYMGNKSVFTAQALNSSLVR